MPALKELFSQPVYSESGMGDVLIQPDSESFAEFDEAKHKRGQPGNPGQFGSGGGGAVPSSGGPPPHTLRKSGAAQPHILQSLSAGHPLSIADIAASTKQDPGHVADEMAELIREGKVEHKVIGDVVQFSLKPEAPESAESQGKAARGEWEARDAGRTERRSIVADLERMQTEGEPESQSLRDTSNDLAETQNLYGVEPHVLRSSVEGHVKAHQEYADNLAYSLKMVADEKQMAKVEKATAGAMAKLQKAADAYMEMAETVNTQEEAFAALDDAEPLDDEDLPEDMTPEEPKEPEAWEEEELPTEPDDQDSDEYKEWEEEFERVQKSNDEAEADYLKQMDKYNSAHDKWEKNVEKLQDKYGKEVAKVHDQWEKEKDKLESRVEKDKASLETLEKKYDDQSTDTLEAIDDAVGEVLTKVEEDVDEEEREDHEPDEDDDTEEFAEWVESKHHRGQPKNAGQFGSGGGGSSGGGESAVRPSSKRTREYINHALGQGKPMTIAAIAKQTAAKPGDIADEMAALLKEGKIGYKMLRGKVAYFPKGGGEGESEGEQPSAQEEKPQPAPEVKKESEASKEPAKESGPKDLPAALADAVEAAPMSVKGHNGLPVQPEDGVAEQLFALGGIDRGKFDDVYDNIKEKTDYDGNNELFRSLSNRFNNMASDAGAIGGLPTARIESSFDGLKSTFTSAVKAMREVGEDKLADYYEEHGQATIAAAREYALKNFAEKRKEKFAEFDPSKHPHKGKGEGGGQFTSGGGGGEAFPTTANKDYTGGLLAAPARLAAAIKRDPWRTVNKEFPKPGEKEQADRDFRDIREAMRQMTREGAQKVFDDAGLGHHGPKAPHLTGAIQRATGKIPELKLHAVKGNSFAHKDAIKAAGGHWDSEARHWVVDDAGAEKLKGKAGLRLQSLSNFSDDVRRAFTKERKPPEDFAEGQWDESKHKRGQPENAGEFGPGGGGGGGGGMHRPSQSQIGALVAKYGKQIKEAKFAGHLPGVRTVASTKDNPLASHEHTTIAHAHALAGAEHHKAGRGDMAQANFAAARYHNDTARRKAGEEAASAKSVHLDNETVRKGIDKSRVEQLSEQAKAWEDSLSEDEKGVARGYSGMGFQINNSLRDDPSGGKLTPMQKKGVELLDAAIDKFGPLKEPVLTYRGVKLKSADARKMVAQFRVAAKTGKGVKLNGFTSTSLNPETAAQFSRQSDYGGDKGYESYTFEVAAKTGAYMEGLTHVKGEHELLQKHGTRYKVKDVGKRVPYELDGKKTWRRVIRLEEI